MANGGTEVFPLRGHPKAIAATWARGTTDMVDDDGKVADIAIGLDRTRDSLFRAVALDAENGTEMTLLADDQYSIRQQKIGYYGSIEEGRMVLDNRVLTGIRVSI